jgi:EAL domain-containing protein (putative c-di-GMP-specific phosphodiesterase class I)
VTVSIGVAPRGPDARDVEELLRKGDLAMYAAKRNGKNRVELYSAELPSDEAAAHQGPSWFPRSDEQRQEIVSILEDPDALTIVYQPIMDLRTGRVAGYEALARVNRTPYRPPNQWFAQAHRCGLGYSLEAKALEAALRTPGRPPGTYLAVNLSPSSLTAAEIAAVLPDRLDDLVIEVTENEMVSGDPAIDAAIGALRRRGARLAVDDTGAGYAGLTHVMRLAPDLIKLDRVLTAGIDTDPMRAALVSSFVRYARHIDATVCSEGIETEAELQRLADLDIGYGQGYFISRPAAPWAALDDAATRTCDASFRAAFEEPGTESGDAADDPDRRLEQLAEALAGARRWEDVEATLRPLAEELAATDARIVFGAAAPPSQLLAGDPDADPAEVARMVADGYHARLVLPIGSVAGLELYNAQERPWMRFHLRRGRIVSHHIASVLERLGPAA